MISRLLIELGIAALAVVFAAAIHIEMLVLAGKRWNRLETQNRDELFCRREVAITFYVLLLAHLIEFAVFAVGLRVADGLSDGCFKGMSPDPHFLDYYYVATVTFTSLGFGDIVPTPGLRTITSICTVSGLMLIGTSATYLVLAMNRYFEHRMKADENAKGESDSR